MKHEMGSKFDLKVGFLKDGKLWGAVPVGYAVRPHGKSYFAVKIWSHPRIVYYLVAHSGRDTLQRYTLFARKTENQAALVHFENPIGQGECSRSRQDLVEIRMHLPRARFYLDLSSGSAQCRTERNAPPPDPSLLENEGARIISFNRKPNEESAQ